jgi:hypothetical protein
MKINQASINDNSLSFISEAKLLEYADKVVSRYVYQGTVPERDREDVKMSVVERFWEKKERIASAYSGEARISTYCIAVLNRMCCEEIRKNMMHWKSRSEDYIQQDRSSVLSSSEQLVIKDETRLLDKIIRLLHEEKSKVLVYLAYFFFLKPKETHIEEYFRNCPQNGIVKLLDPGEIQNKSHLFDNLAKVMNACENKSVQADAVRMWLNKTMDKIIEQLNGPFNRAHYDRESLRTLFEYYYLSDGS